jgi:hypothetical protein
MSFFSGLTRVHRQTEVGCNTHEDERHLVPIFDTFKFDVNNLWVYLRKPRLVSLTVQSQIDQFEFRAIGKRAYPIHSMVFYSIIDACSAYLYKPMGFTLTLGFFEENLAQNGFSCSPYSSALNIEKLGVREIIDIQEDCIRSMKRTASGRATTLSACRIDSRRHFPGEM